MAQLSAYVDRWSRLELPTPPGRLVVPAPLRAYFVSGVAASAEAPVLAVVPGEQDAEELHDDLALFTDAAVLLPAWETLPFEHVSPNASTMARRARARHHLQAGGAGSVVVSSVRALIQRTSPAPVEPIVLAPGAELDPVLLAERLAEFGFHRTNRVEGRGEFAVRGGIVDVYPAGADGPVRIEFWGDEVDSVRELSIATQRSGADARLEAYPTRELRPTTAVRERARALLTEAPWAAATWDRIAEGVLFSGMESWLPWLAPEQTAADELPPNSQVVVFDPVRSSSRAEELRTEERDLAEALAPTWGHAAPPAGDHPDLYLPLESVLGDRPVVEAPPLAAGPTDRGPRITGFDAEAGNPESVKVAIERLHGRGIDVVIAMDGDAAAGRVGKVLAGEGLDLTGLTPGTGSAIIPDGVHRGFVFPDASLAVLGEQEIAGRRRAHRHVTRGRTAPAQRYQDLEEGSYVIHHRHGIGRFEGLVTQEMGGTERDYLLLAYAGADKLYVPTDQLAAVRPYTGGEAPRLSRMGGADWSATRSKVRRELAAVAERVVALHKQRAAITGHAYAPDTPWQDEFEAAFPFEETPDQLSAISAMKADMEGPDPMDRLIFGDVGFGKTEIAIRGAFKAVQDGRQVAVLVPTTLLAQQHHQTFTDRFAPYPVRIEVLSRFLTPKQQKQVVAGLVDGSVDLVIGTHRLLSEDVTFKDLGLLIVDEEQRFGVAAKDRIKELQATVDVLTLTATPIPRTLEMALTGVREVSRIQTPPQDRQPILTYVGPYDTPSVSAAIRRELLREGQVFYVHNRVQSIDHAVARLRDLVPNARYATAHGRMSEGQLEQVMLDFWNHEYDVLVATTIIESGLDLPMVNTLIVERADLLGLAQLYQLRGRVGRSNQRAYAYLFHPPDERLTDVAYRRLEAVGEHTDLGSGFELAMRDLEIRGAGSMLGEVQSGHVAAVGFDLYTELVAEAVQELRGTAPPKEELRQVRIDLDLTAHLPDDYVPDQPARLEAYRTLAAAASHSEVDEVAAEWRERYGPLPREATVLIDIARLRVEALRVGLEDIVKMRNEVKLSPVILSASQEVRLRRLAKRAVVRGPVIFIPAPGDLPGGLIEFVRSMWPEQN
ncbi:MAG: transcription-repair coupling factor, partial [Acidimicrobiia bacterium]|nr:transcription-repair coupling factor [Acidimicrobiia bacterium]